MTTDNGASALIVVWIICLFIFFLFMLISIKMGTPLIQGLWWKTNTSSHVDIQANIIDCKVIESKTRSTTTAGGSTVFLSNYYPVVTVQYEYKGKQFTSDIPLHIEGYALPDSAFSAIARIAPAKKIRYIQTSTKKIDNQIAQILSSIRVHTDDQKTSTIPLTIDKGNPGITNYSINKGSLAEWIMPAVFLLIGITPVILIFLLVRVLPFSIKLNSLLITLLLLYLTVHGIPFLLKKLNVSFASTDSPPLLEILIDDSYDGSQLTPYLTSDQPQENQ